MYPNVDKYTQRDVQEILHETFGSPTPPIEEILRHKWLESEKAGRDIGLATSMFDWKAHHYDQWRQAMSCPRVKTRVYLNSRPTTRIHTKRFILPAQEEPISAQSEGVPISLPMWLLAGLKNQLGS